MQVSFVNEFPGGPRLLSRPGMLSFFVFFLFVEINK
jgi:hypothetical protein